MVGSADTAPEPEPTPIDNISAVADAGSDQVVPKRTTVYLNGSNSSHSDGSIVSYHWKHISGKTVTLKNTNNVMANFNSPRVRNGRTKTLIFELTVTDDLGVTSNDLVVIKVKG